MEKNKNFTIIFVMLFVACLTGFTSDIYTPSFLTMAHDFRTSIPSVQSSMGVFMFAVSVSQLIYGPASEIVGRRVPLMIGLAIMLIGSVICFYAVGIDTLLLGRFVQGLGSGACACLWRSIFRDSFDTTQITKYGGYLGIIMVFVVAAAPALGGCFEQSFGWRASFMAIIIYCATTLCLVIFYLDETSIYHHKDRMSLAFFKDAFGQLLSSRIFMGYGFCVFCTFGAFFSWFVVGSVLLIDDLGVLPTEFGIINLFCGGTAMALGGFFNGKMAVRLGRFLVLRLGWWMIFSSGIMILLLDRLYGHTVFSLMTFIFTFLFGATLIWSNAFAEAFAPFGAIAGCAGTLYSCMQFGGGAVIGWLSSFLPSKDAGCLAIILIVASLSALSMFEFVIRKHQNP